MLKLVFLAVLALPALSMQSAKPPKPPKPPKVEIPRSPHEQARIDFRHAHPCPTSGRDSGACPGYVVGYLTQLSCGGMDVATNMQWQTPEQAKAANKAAKAGCASPAR